MPPLKEKEGGVRAKGYGRGGEEGAVQVYMFNIGHEDTCINQFLVSCIKLACVEGVRGRGGDDPISPLTPLRPDSGPTHLGSK